MTANKRFIPTLCEQILCLSPSNFNSPFTITATSHDPTAKPSPPHSKRMMAFHWIGAVWLSLTLNPAICLCYFIGDVLVVTSRGHTQTHTHCHHMFLAMFLVTKVLFSSGNWVSTSLVASCPIATRLHISLVFAPAALNHHFPDCQFPH
jgi:hypothetical protein